MSNIVTGLWRYPVKSLRGERVEQLAVDGRGAVGDRGYAIVTEAGKPASGKNTSRFERVDGLLSLAATLSDDGVASIVADDGSSVSCDDPSVHRFVSERLGRALTVQRESNVSHLDAGPLHLIGTASVAWLAERTPNVPTDERRLRPNIVFESAEALLEDQWAGRTVRIGTATLRVLRRTERCVMVTHAQSDLPVAPTALRAIADDNQACLGIYAEIIEPGTMGVGDTLELS